MAGLIETLGLSRPAVMGHSMGAGTASVLASEFPQLVGVLILEDPPWRDSAGAAPPHAHAGEWEKQILERKQLSRDELLAQGRADNPTWPEAVFPPWIEAKYAVSPNVVKFITTSDLSWENAVPGIECPALLITGDPDLGAIVTPEIAKQVQEANGNIEVAHIVGAGHNIRREQFDAYITAVNAFLGKHYPSA